MHWAYPEQFWMLGLIPVAALLWWWAHMSAQSRLNRFADQALLEALASGVLCWRRLIKAVIVFFAAACALVALMGPQWGSKWQEKTTQVSIDSCLTLRLLGNR